MGDGVILHRPSSVQLHVVCPDASEKTRILAWARLANEALDAFEPLQARYRVIEEDPGYIDQVLRDSVDKLKPTVTATMDKVRQVMGLR